MDVSQQSRAEINIFTVASGLLYEVSTGLGLLTVGSDQYYTAICVNHDSQCTSKHEEFSQILVHREFLVAIIPRVYNCRAR